MSWSEIRSRVFAVFVWTVAAHAFGASPCLPCHRAQVLGYEKNGMSRSLSHSLKQPSGSFTHQASGTHFVVNSAGASAQISLSRNGVSATYPVAFMIGSGIHASGDIVRIGDYLFQAPITYLTGGRRWAWLLGTSLPQNPTLRAQLRQSA